MTFFWLAKLPNGLLVMSEAFDDFDDAYDAYCDAMFKMRSNGTDLSTLCYRGVFDAADATEYMTDHMQGAN